MKAIQFSSANVVKSTIRCMNQDMDAATSISKGMMLETLKKRMMRGEVVCFCYMKLDGTIRYAVGTLQHLSSIFFFHIFQVRIIMFPLFLYCSEMGK